MLCETRKSSEAHLHKWCKYSYWWNGYITDFGLYVREYNLISYESTLVERVLSK